MDIYEYVKNIGNGMYGQVFLANHKLEQKLYAIKRINFKDINVKDRENIENEVKLLKDLKHPNIVSYKDSFCDRENYFNIVMSYCDGGDLYNKVKNAKGKYYQESEIIDWIIQLGLALLYIHDKKILHRDFKTQNLFLKEGKIRIGDFGIAKMFNHTKDLANSVIIPNFFYTFNF
jgi:non-specific serine/threonine protein kinase/NIMA (never in mitosis gene a)-related kinase